MRLALTIAAALLGAPQAGAAPAGGLSSGLDAGSLVMPAALCAPRGVSCDGRATRPYGRPRRGGVVYIPGPDRACYRRRMSYCGPGPLDKPFERPPNMMPPRPF